MFVSVTFTEGSVRMKGLEPPRLSAPDPKSGTATNYATSAYYTNSLLSSMMKPNGDPNPLGRTTSIPLRHLDYNTFDYYSNSMLRIMV